MYNTVSSAVYTASLPVDTSSASSISIWTIALPALIALFGVVGGNILTHFLGIRAVETNRKRERRNAVYLELRGLTITLSQLHYTSYEVSVNVRIHEVNWERNPKDTFQLDQAIYYSRRHDELTITVAEETKKYYEKLAEVRLLFVDNLDIQKYIDEIEKMPLYLEDSTDPSSLMTKKDEILKTYKRNSEELYWNPLVKLSDLIRKDLSTVSGVKRIIIEAVIGYLRKFM